MQLNNIFCLLDIIKCPEGKNLTGEVLSHAHWKVTARFVTVMQKKKIHLSYYTVVKKDDCGVLNIKRNLNLTLFENIIYCVLP